MQVSSPSNSFYLWIENKIKSFSFPLFQLYLSKSILHILNWPYSKLKRSTGRLGYTLNAETHNIRLTWIGKEEVKLSLFAEDMLLYKESPKDTTKKLLELIN